MAKKKVEVIHGGCTCGFWAKSNCEYVKAVGMCRESAILRHAQEQEAARLKAIQESATPDNPERDTGLGGQ